MSKILITEVIWEDNIHEVIWKILVTEVICKGNIHEAISKILITEVMQRLYSRSNIENIT